jgi:hypothetical protein
MDAPSNPPDLVEAFPSTLELQVRAVVAIMPTPDHPRSPDDIGRTTLDGRLLRIPARIYHPELGLPGIASLSRTEQSIAACLYTRHHDGHVRQRALAHVLDIDEAWAAPFVVQHLGEYVIELVEMVAVAAKGPPKRTFVAFLRENPGFLQLTTERATSYWHEYYRGRFSRREDYPAFCAIPTLREWANGRVA